MSVEKRQNCRVLFNSEIPKETLRYLTNHFSVLHYVEERARLKAEVIRHYEEVK